jgi:phospholipid/cholesterol/gamma-HCH transport system substrate-binding protein
MPKEKGHSIKLGLFISAGIALFTLGIYFIGDRQQLFSKTFRISGVFKDISGLQVGDNVRFSGINVGVVENILQITDSTVKVDMLINEDTKPFLKKNATAMIGSDGLMGDKIVMITPGAVSTQKIQDYDHLQTVKAVNMDDILEKLKITSDNAASITGNLADIMINIRDGKGTIGKLFVDSAFAKNVEQALVNIRKGTGGFKENMEAASHNVLLRGYFKKKNKNTNGK